MKGISGIQKVSVYDPATGTTVQLNNVSSEGDFQKGVFESENTKGQPLYSGDDSFFEFIAFEHTGFAQLETWMKAETLVRLVVLGLEQHILWYESSKITVEKSYPVGVGSRTGFKLRIQTKGGLHNILVGSNILYLINGWVDANTDEVADNYTAEGVAFDTKDFNDSTFVQNLGTSGSGIIEFSPSQIIFPIAGASLQLSYDKISLTIPGALTLEVDQYIYSGFNQMDNTALTDAVLTFTTVASFWKMLAKIIDGTSSAGFDIEMKYPYLGVPMGEHQNILY